MSSAGAYSKALCLHFGDGKYLSGFDSIRKRFRGKHRAKAQWQQIEFKLSRCATYAEIETGKAHSERYQVKNGQAHRPVMDQSIYFCVCRIAVEVKRKNGHE